MLPHDKEAEQGVLGAIIHNNYALEQVLMLGITPEMFFSPGHRLIFKAMSALEKQGAPIDEITLGNYLRQHDRLAQAGGLVYMAELVDVTPVTANVLIYAEIVRDVYGARRVKEAALAFSEEADYSPNRVKAFQAEIANLQNERVAQRAFTADQVLTQFAVHAGEVQRGERRPFQVQTGTAFDNYTGGLAPGYPHIVGARLGNGKTQFMQAVVKHNALHSDPPVPTLILSLEMKSRELCERFLCDIGRIPGRKIVHGRYDELTPPEADQLTDACEKFAQMPVYFEGDGGRMSIDEIRASVRYHVHNKGVRLVCLDHLIKIVAPGRTGEERQSNRQEGLTELAKQLDVVILELVQISREGDAEPTMKDLGWSDLIGQDAFSCFLLQAPPDPVTADDPRRDFLNVHLAKNRNGHTARLQLAWWPSVFRIGPMTRQEVAMPTAKQERLV